MKSINQKIPHSMKKIINQHNAILQINLKNIENNYNYIKNIAPNSKIAACVKANSYGLGSDIVCKSLYKLKCRDFFVATAAEALSLRQTYKNINIYLLNGVSASETLLKIYNLNIITVINNMQQYYLIKKFFGVTKKRIKCCLHIDSGMNRLGISYKDFIKNLYSFQKNLDVKIIISHLINSEKKSKLNNTQLKIFTDIKNKCNFSKKVMFSLGNSNSTFLKHNFHFDMIRAGGYLYGLDLSNKNKSKNVLTLKAKIIQIEKVKKGQSIGYGAKYFTKKTSTIATLAIGYADGLPRSYDGYAFYKNKKVKFVGNISMDLSCLDVSSVRNPKINDWVEIFGNNISISIFASKCSTISYEISSKIGTRVKRIYN